MARTPRTPLQRAVGLLSRREHSRLELQRKLVQRGEDPVAVVDALDRLAGEGLQDEARFADSLIRQRVASGYGPRYISAELATHRLPAELIDECLARANIDWRAQAAELLARRFPAGMNDPAERRRAAAMLHRRGFAADCLDPSRR